MSYPHLVLHLLLHLHLLLLLQSLLSRGEVLRGYWVLRHHYPGEENQGRRKKRNGANTKLYNVLFVALLCFWGRRRAGADSGDVRGEGGPEEEQHITVVVCGFVCGSILESTPIRFMTCFRNE
jgi:hypothetical protein